MKSRHVKSRSGKWSRRKHRPQRRLTRFRHPRRRGYLYSDTLRSYNIADVKWTSATYARFVTFGSRNVGKSAAMRGITPGLKKLPPGWASWSPHWGNMPTTATAATGKALSQHAAGAAIDFTAFTEAMKQLSLTVQAIPAALAKLLEGIEVKEDQLVAPGSSPDIAGTVVGYRVWEVDGVVWQGNVATKLGSVAQSYFWEPGRNEAKLCPINSDEEPHPYPWCQCGFWAVNDPVDLPYPPGFRYQDAAYVDVSTFGSLRKEEMLYQRAGWQGYIMGKIEGWGVVVEHMMGFRAQYAKVTELYYPPMDSRVGGEEFVHSIGVAYGVPVVEPDFDFYRD